MENRPVILLAVFLLFTCALFAQTAKDQNTQKPKAIKVLSENSGQTLKENTPRPAPKDTAQANPSAKPETPQKDSSEEEILSEQPAVAQEQEQQNPYDIYDKLSLSEKLAQTIVIATDIDNADKYKEAIQAGLVSGVLIQWGDYSLQQTKKLIDKLQGWAQKSPHKIPLLISIDYEGGTVYTPVTLGFPYLPTNMMLAAAQNEEATATLFYIVATELKNVGVHINFAPVVDVNINPANPIIGVRSFGADTEVVGKMGAAVIEGMQKGGVMAVAKHFPGHGETITDSHLDLPRLNMTKEEFYKVHLPPFKEAIDNNVMGIMTAHIVYDFLDSSNPATFSPKILNGLLKQELGFKGLVISDSLDMAGATKGSSLIEASAKALNSGVDMILTSKRSPKLTHKQLMEKVGKEISKSRVEEASRKVFDLKVKLGLFDDKQYRGKILDSIKAFNVYAGRIAEQAVTVVRSQEGVIPYTKNLPPQETLPQQEDTTISPAENAGTEESSEAKPQTPQPQQAKQPKLCSLFFSPARFADQLPIIIAPFLEKNWQVDYYNAHMRPKQIDIKRAKKCMENADLVILGSLQWADKPISSQKKAIDELLKENKDIILISLMSPYDIKFYPQAKNVIAMYGVNKLSARVAAEIILGNIKAQGKLPILLPPVLNSGKNN